MEVLANEYLTDLVARNLVLVAQRSSRNGIKKCSVHDLLRQLCLIKAEEERFFLVLNMSDHPSSMRYDHYRLCVHCKWEPFTDSEPNVPSIRSLLVSCRGFSCSSAPSFWNRFKLLRVLDLSWVFVGETDFVEITQLIHLRFLSVICQFLIPSSTVSLFRLEVLRLRYFDAGGILPSAVIKMANLRHIIAGRCSIQEDFDKMSPPLTNLVTFTSLDYVNESSFKRVAHKLPNVLKLALTLSFCVRLSSYFKKLESLNLCILWRTQETVAVSPSTLDFPLTLKKLNLTAESPLSGAMISSIGKLSNLEVLKLHEYFEEERWVVEDDEFLQLKYFEFRFSSLKKWNVSDESFPCLEQLVVKECPKLGELPSRFGAITTLKRIGVHNCRDSVRNSFQQIVDDRMGCGNEDLQFSISYHNPKEKYEEYF